MVYKTKKAQGLPLNTIVIALLVVVVLVVLIFAVVNNMGQSQSEIDEIRGAGACNPDNNLVIAQFGSDAIVNGEEETCQPGFGRVQGVPGNGENTACCAQRRPATTEAD